MSEETRKFKLIAKQGSDSRTVEEKEMARDTAAKLNDLFKDEESPLRWIDKETGEEVYPTKPPQPGELGHERVLTDLEAANEKLLELLTERPAEFILGLHRMMGQAAYDVFIIWEQYRSQLHDRTIPGNVIISEPQRPEDLPIMAEMSAVLKVFTNDKMLDDCLKVAQPGKDQPNIKWNGEDGSSTTN